MKDNCSCKRGIPPHGLWSIDNLIGAKVVIISTSIGNFLMGFDANEERTIKDVQFRISIDGKAITLVTLEGLEGKTFTLKDLEFIEMTDTENPEIDIIDC